MTAGSIPLTLARVSPARAPQPDRAAPIPLRALIEAFDWGATPLGPIGSWPAIRRRRIELICASQTAIATMWGKEGVLIYNDACAALLGRWHPHSLGRMAREAPGGVRRLILDILRRTLESECVILPDHCLVADRNGRPERVWLGLSSVPIIDGAGRIDGAHVVLRDTTAEVRGRAAVEAELRQAHKMDAIGQMTGGISHDFNNILTGILGNLDMLAARLEQGEIVAARSYLDGARSAAARAAGLTQRLLAFARRQTLAPAAIDIPALIEDMHELIDRMAGPAIAVRTICPPDIRLGFCDRNQLENALLNLAINARDAMPEGGVLTLAAANAMLGPPPRGQRRGEGAYVRIGIADTGKGMTEAVMAQAFEPFFTTKPAGQGTGLGLSMVYGFVQQSGGHVEIASRIGEGTTVDLFIPCPAADMPAAPATETLAEVAPLASRLPAGRDVVLIVDDEDALRSLLADMLGEQGFAVRQAAEAESGLDWLRADPTIGLLIADIGLPGAMNGLALAASAREMRPDLPVLFVTGLAEEAGEVAAGDSVTGDGAARTAMLRKPFTFECLCRQLFLLLHGDDDKPPIG
ncbi:ATP-binding protein [Acidiphilium sp. C61]|uniref:ATP-binding protein n=1 Tax=Acidiphilium sp. C61 TaxID=1671485 RepID=UPI00157B56E2|nr:ATP-binding protein [Acidiphilium sp. C61]